MQTPQPGFNYHAVMNNFFTSNELVSYLQPKSIATTVTVWPCQMENPPLKEEEVVPTEHRGQCDVAVEQLQIWLQ